ncbi:hypothetical protein [Microbacterium sp. 2FI]|uniref:hypothetical protein n=1 Tax=Microbacterium sp. 2FI TaxID=2502193 RepID=UPI0010F95D00|nr:hypothetical protein [Microbacterium sp. 2FI]
MTDPRDDAAQTDTPLSSLLRAAIWVAIGALIAAAIVCVIWVLVGSQNGIVGRAFLTILLLVGFAGVAILDAHLAPKRPAWFALASMASWVVALLVGAVMIWMPERYAWGGFSRLLQFLVIVLILQLALLHVRLYAKAFQRYVTPFTQVVAVITIALVVGLAALLIIPLVLSEYTDFPELYWRVVVAVAILAAVGTTLIPLVNVLFAPRRPRAPRPTGIYAPQQPQGYPSYAQNDPYAALPAAPADHRAAEAELLPWPNFADGYTPLPMLPDGSPDWNAYYTGQPTPGAHVFALPQAAVEPAPVAPAAPGYEGYPPPPPLPPRS